MSGEHIPVTIAGAGASGAGCAEAEPFALQVLDDAMEPEFPRGCIIIVDPAGRARAGAFVMAELDGQYLFRRLTRDPDGYVLTALNPGYAPLPLREGLGAVRGVIVQRAGRRRRDAKRYD